MNVQNTNTKILRESKNRIRVDFERTPLKDRLKARFLNVAFLTKVVVYIFRLLLLIGISYVVLYPFIAKICASFMAGQDFIDATVRLIPKNFTLEQYQKIISELGYFDAFKNTFILSFSCAVFQTFVCCLIGYGLAKFRFKGNKILFLLVMLTMIIPHQTLRLSMYYNFRHFDILGIFQLLGGGGFSILDGIKADATGFLGVLYHFNEGVKQAINIAPHTVSPVTGSIIYTSIWDAGGLNLTNTYAPLILLSMTGLAFKNGLYIFLLRQFFNGIPDELEESAYIDGAGTFRTFIQIILPISIPMMITVFLFSFCWQWTDNFYTNIFFTSNSKIQLLVNIVGVPRSILNGTSYGLKYQSAIKNTCGLMIIAPLVVIYLFLQRYLVEGIERSGITG